MINNLIALTLAGDITIPANLVKAVLAALAVVVFCIVWMRRKQDTLSFRVFLAFALLLMWAGVFSIIRVFWE